MRYLIIIALVAFAACNMPEVTSIERADTYVSELLEENDPATLECPSSAAVGDTFQCNAQNAAGTNIDNRLVSHHDTNFGVVTNGGDLTVQTPNDIIRLSTV